MSKIALSRMADVFLPPVLMQGQDYHQKGHVLSCRFSDGLVKARVKGTGNEIYDVYIDLKSWPKTQTQCNCSSKINCKHAAASLFALNLNQSIPPDSSDIKKFSDPNQKNAFDSIPEEIVEADKMEWFSAIQTERHDFFSYQLGILIDGKQVNIIPLLVSLLSTLDKHTITHLSGETLLKMPSVHGKILQIELKRIKPLVDFLLMYGTRTVKKNKGLTLSHYQLMLMLETEQAIHAASSRWQGTETIRKQLQQLKNQTFPHCEIPKKITVTLRDYQNDGLNWLQCLRAHHLGGVLADDMGLGKTIQTLAHLQLEKEQGRLSKPSLIVVPTSLIGNWLNEAQRFTPDLTVLPFHGTKRHQDDFENYDIIVSTYGLIQRDKTRFVNHEFYYLILDEAQYIKNIRAKTTQMIQQIKANHRLCLTGTPLQNHLGELWSLFHFLMPGLLGTYPQFRHLFKNPIEKKLDLDTKKTLIQRVQPFILRRTKNQVAQELPNKTEIIQPIELFGPQRDLYEIIRISMKNKIREAIQTHGLQKSHIFVLDALLKLRQICCHPKLLTMPEAAVAHGTSAKLQTLMQLLENLINEGRRVLIFSQFTSMLALIEEELIKHHYDYLTLTGQTQNRQTLINTFQEGHIPVFLISLKAGGVGLNLTRADTVIHYDPWWNPAVEDQATDRSHRIGQKNPVFVYKLIASGTVEETMLAMHNKKRELVDDILSDNALGLNQLKLHDLEELFN